MVQPPRPPHADLRSLLNSAIACLNNADLAQADGLLSRALAAAPRDHNVLQLIGALRRAQNRNEEAQTFYNRSLALNPNQPQVHSNLGSLHLALGRSKEAIAAQKRAIQQKPDFVDAHLGLALALSAEGDHDAAMAACHRALQFQPDSVIAKHLLATELLDARRPAEAEAILEDLLKEKRNAASVPLKFNLALSLKQQGRHEEALALFETMGGHPLPQRDISIAESQFGLRRYEAARETFRNVLTREPENAGLLSHLALTSACLADFAEARQYAQKVKAISGRNSLASVVLALCDFADGEWDNGVAAIGHLLADENAVLDDWANFAIARAADQLDKQDRCAAAFSLTMAMNERRRRTASALEPVRAITDVRRLQNYFDRSVRWPKVATPPDGVTAGHVFVLGFMRSGTTLVASALAAHENVVAADEKDFFTEAAAAFLLGDKGLDALAALPSAEIARWRASYWQNVRARGFAVQDKVFVEKMPFNALRLPLIARLFPDAKILLALRDPRDVVLSCVRQQFDLTPFSYEFLRLADCAQFYADAMTLIARYREVLPLNLMEYRYEDVVSDYAGSVGRLCDFAGLNWRKDMARFADASGFVDPLSASAAQVRKDLYSTSAGQWRRYKKELEPIMPVLAPWIAQLGYPE